MVNQIAIPGVIAPAAVMHFQCDNIGRILQYAEIALSPRLRPVVRLSFVGNDGNQPDVGILQPLDEKHLFRKENVPAAGSACQKSIVSLCRAPHDLIRQQRLYADRRSRQLVFTKGQ